MANVVFQCHLFVVTKLHCSCVYYDLNSVYQNQLDVWDYSKVSADVECLRERLTATKQPVFSSNKMNWRNEE